VVLPKLVKKSLDVRSLKRKAYKLKKSIVELEKGDIGESQSE
jgi:hypothetical protein